MLKNIILLLIVFYALSTRAYSLRETCENAYYATDYVKLHEYKLVIDWSKVSDHGLMELENIIYENMFDVTLEKDIAQTSKTIFHLKEVKNLDALEYELALEELSKLSFGNLNCLYNL